jgi:hypothetical protein
VVPCWPWTMLWIPLVAGWLWSVPATAGCRVQVEGLPVPQMRHHALRVGARRYPVAAVVELDPVATAVELVGPRYAGRTSLETCGEGVTLQATPRPAMLQLEELPPKAVLSCRGCPGLDPSDNFLPAHLPPMVMKRWAQQVTLWVRAPGFLPLETSVILHPGKNVFRLDLERRPPR